MKRSEESTSTQSPEEQTGTLHCWRCRKCIASSGCFMSPLETQLVEQDRHESVDAQNTCHLWHMNVDALPEWISCLLQKTVSNEMSTDEETEFPEEKDSYMCAVCLDVYFNPYMCYPCHHIFCEPCLRTLAKDNPASTPCPLCRTIISRVFLQTELNNATKTFFTKEYLKIKQSFQKSSSAKWPLPSCRKGFHLFGGFHRRAAPVTRRQFPHGAHRMDYLHFEDDSRGWWFDMDMVIIYIYSVNWVIGFVVFCFLCYFFFPF